MRGSGHRVQIDLRDLRVADQQLTDIHEDRSDLVEVDRRLAAGDALNRAVSRAPHLPRGELVRALHFLLTVGLIRTVH